MIARFPILLATLAALPLFAAQAHAGGNVTIGVQHHGKHGSIGIQIGSPYGSHRPAPPRYGGHYENVVERVWVPGCTTRVWIAPIYETRYDSCGRPRTVCVRAGYWDLRQSPGHYAEHTRRVWRPAGWRHGSH